MPNVMTTVLLPALVWAAPALLFGSAGTGANLWPKSGPNRPDGLGGHPQVFDKQAIAVTPSFITEREGFEPSVQRIPRTTV